VGDKPVERKAESGFTGLVWPSDDDMLALGDGEVDILKCVVRGGAVPKIERCYLDNGQFLDDFRFWIFDFGLQGIALQFTV
jgi:hypothetical protein